MEALSPTHRLVMHNGRHVYLGNGRSGLSLTATRHVTSRAAKSRIAFGSRALDVQGKNVVSRGRMAVPSSIYAVIAHTKPLTFSRL